MQPENECVDEEKYRVEDFQRAMGRCDMAVRITGKSPRSISAEGISCKPERMTHVIVSAIEDGLEWPVFPAIRVVPQRLNPLSLDWRQGDFFIGQCSQPLPCRIFFHQASESGKANNWR